MDGIFCHSANSLKNIDRATRRLWCHEASQNTGFMANYFK